MTIRPFLLFALLGVVGSVAPASATPVTYAFDGTVTGRFATTARDPITGLPTTTLDPTYLAYWFPGLSFDGPVDVSGTVVVDPDAETVVSARATLGSHVFAGDSNGFVGDPSSTIGMVDFSPSIVSPMPSNLFNADDLVLTLPLNGAAGFIAFDADFWKGFASSHMSWSGSVSILPTPEPPVWALMLASVALMAGIVRLSGFKLLPGESA